MAGKLEVSVLNYVGFTELVGHINWAVQCCGLDMYYEMVELTKFIFGIVSDLRAESYSHAKKTNGECVFPESWGSQFSWSVVFSDRTACHYV